MSGSWTSHLAELPPQQMNPYASTQPATPCSSSHSGRSSFLSILGMVQLLSTASIVDGWVPASGPSVLPVGEFGV